VRRATWLGLFLIAGCGAPAVRTPPLDVAVPAAWDHPADPSPVPADWWVGLDDDGTLSALVEEALTHNRNLQVAAANVEVARANAAAQGADLWPQVSGSASATRRKTNFAGFGLPFATGDEVLTAYTSSATASLMASWEPDLWGRVRHARGAALADWMASDADLAGARLSVAAQVGRAWFGLIEARHQLTLAEQTEAAFAATARIAADRWRAGLGVAVDVRLTRTNAANASTLVAQRRDALQRAQRQLEILLGRYPAGAIEPGPDLPTLTAPVPASLPADLIARRPDLAAAERRLAASESRAASARGLRYPRFSLTASGGTSSEELRDLLDGDFGVWTLAGNLFQPIFQGGRIRAQIRAADATTDAALARYVDTALRAYAEVESGLRAESLLADQERHLAAAAREAAASRELADDRYRRGVGPLLTVIEAQRLELNARSSLLALKRQRLTQRIDLIVALGGGFDRTLPTSAETTP